MKVMQIQKYGGPEVLRYVDAPPPEPAERELLVRVEAASVNPVDWKIRKGSLRLIHRPKFPLVLGCDVCGQVEQVGSQAGRFQVGDWVYAMLPLGVYGGYAGYTAVKEQWAAKKPEKLSPEEAAGVPLAGLTALQALRDRGRLQPGHRVLVIGASGGVGHYAVQIAKAMDAKVTAICSTGNVGWVAELGADRVIDYRQEEYRQLDEQYDIILDAVATASFLSTRHLLNPAGIYVTTIPKPGVLLTSAVLPIVSKRRARFIMVKPSGTDLETLANLSDQGQLRSVIDQSFPLSHLSDAHRHSESGRTKGKLIIKMHPQDHIIQTGIQSGTG